MPEKEYVLGNKTKDLLAYSFVVTKPIVKNFHAANDCSFQTEYDRRLDLIHAALNDCNLLLKLVEISQALGYISVKRMGHWTKLITDVKYMTLAWKKKDTERAKTLRRQEETRDYELQASIIAGAVARALGRR